MSTVQPILDDMHTRTPHLVCAGAAAAIYFYVKAFKAVELAGCRGPTAKMMHAMVKIGDSPLMLFDEVSGWGSRSPLTLKGTPVIIHMYVRDVDASIAQAVAAGATRTVIDGPFAEAREMVGGFSVQLRHARRGSRDCHTMSGRALGDGGSVKWRPATSDKPCLNNVDLATLMCNISTDARFNL